MLKRPILHDDGFAAVLTRAFTGRDEIPIEEPRPGVVITMLNGECMLPAGQQRPYEMSYPEGIGPCGSPYGVCDSWEQILEMAPGLESDPRPFVVFVSEIRHEGQTSPGGWRWHKWGPYIGNHRPQHEYLADEVGIDRVFVYHIIQLMDDEIDPDQT